MKTQESFGILPLAVLSIGAFATVVSATMFSPLLPAIAAEFGVSESIAGQVGTPAALVAVVVALALSAWMVRGGTRSTGVLLNTALRSFERRMAPWRVEDR